MWCTHHGCSLLAATFIRGKLVLRRLRLLLCSALGDCVRTKKLATYIPPTLITDPPPSLEKVARLWEASWQGGCQASYLELVSEVLLPLEVDVAPDETIPDTPQKFYIGISSEKQYPPHWGGRGKITSIIWHLGLQCWFLPCICDIGAERTFV